MEIFKQGNTINSVSSTMDIEETGGLKIKHMANKFSRLNVKVLVAQLFLTFVTPRTTALQAPLSKEFSRGEYCSVWPCPPPGDLPDPSIPHGSNPALLHGRQILYHLSHQGSPKNIRVGQESSQPRVSSKVVL